MGWEETFTMGTKQKKLAARNPSPTSGSAPNFRDSLQGVRSNQRPPMDMSDGCVEILSLSGETQAICFLSGTNRALVATHGDRVAARLSVMPGVHRLYDNAHGYGADLVGRVAGRLVFFFWCFRFGLPTHSYSNDAVVQSLINKVWYRTHEILVGS